MGGRSLQAAKNRKGAEKADANADADDSVCGIPKIVLAVCGIKLTQPQLHARLIHMQDTAAEEDDAVLSSDSEWSESDSESDNDSSDSEDEDEDEDGDRRRSKKVSGKIEEVPSTAGVGKSNGVVSRTGEIGAAAGRANAKAHLSPDSRLSPQAAR